MMKKILCVLALTLSTTGFAAEITNKSSLEKQVGYSLGYSMATNNSEVFKNIDLDAFLQGFKTALKGKNATLTMAEMGTAISQYRQASEAKELLEFQKQAAENLAKEKEFLAKNAKKSAR